MKDRESVIRAFGVAALLTALLFIQTSHASQMDDGAKTEFLKAVARGDASTVKEMLTKDVTLAGARDANGVSAILMAAYYRKKEVVDLLLASGIELNVFEAAATGQTGEVKRWTRRDPTLVNAFNGDGFMPLGLAVFFGHRETVEALLSAGADVNLATREKMKVTPLQSAAAAKRADIARLLIARGADVNARQAENQFTPLHEVALNGDIEFARLLLEHGADINARTTDWKTPLSYALAGGQSEMAAFLSRRGAVK